MIIIMVIMVTVDSYRIMINTDDHMLSRKKELGSLNRAELVSSSTVMVDCPG